MAHRRNLWFLALAIGSILLHTIQAAATPPASQPSRRQDYPRVSCNDWEKEAGREGVCTVETEITTWEIGYYREGRERRSLLNRVKNIVVVFRPTGEDHKVYSWWNEMVGADRPIDTRKWLVLSLGVIGDRKPTTGNPVFLTRDEVLKSQMAVLDYLYPYRTHLALVAGLSQGADIALAWASEFGDRIRKLALVAGALPTTFSADEKMRTHQDQQRTVLLNYEMQHGPVEFWSDEIQKNFWTEVWQEVITESGVYYPSGFFEDAENMKEVGLDAADYIGPTELKRLVVDQWVEYFRENTTPHWFLAQQDMATEMQKSMTRERLARIPVRNIAHIGVLQMGFTPEDVEVLKADQKVLNEVGKRTEFVLIDDKGGESVTYSPNINEEILDFFRSYLGG